MLASLPPDIGEHRYIQILVPTGLDGASDSYAVTRIVGSVHADARFLLRIIDHIEGVALYAAMRMNDPENRDLADAFDGDEELDHEDEPSALSVIRVVVDLENDQPLESIKEMGIMTKSAARSVLESLQRRGSTIQRRVEIGRANVHTPELACTVEAHDGCINAVAATPSGEQLVSTGQDGEIFVWDTDSWRGRAIDLDKEDVRSYSDAHRSALAISADGAWLAWAYDGYPTITLDRLDGSERREHMNYREAFDGRYIDLCQHYQGCDQVFSSFAFSPNGQWLATGGVQSPLVVWSTMGDIGPIVLEEPDEFDTACSLAFSPDGKTLVQGQHNCGEIRMWDTQTWGRCRTINAVTNAVDDDIRSLQFNARGTRLLLGGGFTHARVRVLYLRQKRKGWQDLGYHGKAHPDPCNDYEYVNSVGFLSGNRMAYSVGRTDGLIKFWDIADHQQVHEIDANQGGIESASLISNRRLVTAGIDGTLKVWDLSKSAV